MVMPGAFAQTLRTRGLRRIPMLFQHDPAEPIGVWLDLFEDGRGLRARGRLIADVARAREVLALVRAGAIDGLSIGFRTVRGRIDPRTRVRRLEQIDLWEISIVTFPLLSGARVRAVENAKATSAAHPFFSARRAATTPPRAERAWRTITSAGAARRNPSARQASA
jgi:HK97 family phage prohead protease